MIKRFVYKAIETKVKTNQTKGGLAYFGDKDIKGELESAYKRVIYRNGQDCPEDIVVVEVFEELKSLGIAPFEVTYGNTSYRGVKITDVKDQQKPETE